MHLASGMWTKARAVAALSPEMISYDTSSVNPNSSLAQVYVEFKTPLFLPSCVTLSATDVNFVTDSKSSSSNPIMRSERHFDVCNTTNPQDRIPYLRGKFSWVSFK